MISIDRQARCSWTLQVDIMPNIYCATERKRDDAAVKVGQVNGAAVRCIRYLRPERTGSAVGASVYRAYLRLI